MKDLDLNALNGKGVRRILLSNTAIERRDISKEGQQEKIHNMDCTISVWDFLIVGPDDFLTENHEFTVSLCFWAFALERRGSNNHSSRERILSMSKRHTRNLIELGISTYRVNQPKFWIYHLLNSEKTKELKALWLKSQLKGGEQLSFWVPKPGSHNITIFPPTKGATNHVK